MKLENFHLASKKNDFLQNWLLVYGEICLVVHTGQCYGNGPRCDSGSISVQIKFLSKLAAANCPWVLFVKVTIMVNGQYEEFMQRTHSFREFIQYYHKAFKN